MASVDEKRQAPLNTFAPFSSGMFAPLVPVVMYVGEIGEPCHTPTPIVPTCVKDDIEMPVASVVPVNADAGQDVAAIVPEPLIERLAPEPTTIAAAVLVPPVRLLNAPPEYCGMLRVPPANVAAPLLPVVVSVNGEPVRSE